VLRPVPGRAAVSDDHRVIVAPSVRGRTGGPGFRSTGRPDRDSGDAQQRQSGQCQYTHTFALHLVTSFPRVSLIYPRHPRCRKRPKHVSGWTPR